MKQAVDVDYIIVGQGLAGSAAALQFLKNGRRILVIDNAEGNHSSRVAAGLFNPVTGRNFVKTWLADRLFPYLHRFYAEAERLTLENFFSPMPVYRPFLSVHEQNEWMGRSAERGMEAYVAAVETSTRFTDGVNDPHGGLLLRQAGYLDTSRYLDAVRRYIAAKGHLENGHFDQARLAIAGGGVHYGEYRAKGIIFCQGVGALLNKWFKNLPIRPLKGETITIKSRWETDVILNRGVYIVPGSVPGEYKVGSTFKVNDNSPGISEEARRDMEMRLRGLISVPYEVIGQNWGVRPSTPDRRPVLGCHAEFEQLIIFNGLGTKGVSLAPYFSDTLYRWLEDHDSLEKEVDVSRYY